MQEKSGIIRKINETSKRKGEISAHFLLLVFSAYSSRSHFSPLLVLLHITSATPKIAIPVIVIANPVIIISFLKFYYPYKLKSLFRGILLLTLQSWCRHTQLLRRLSLCFPMVSHIFLSFKLLIIGFVRYNHHTAVKVHFIFRICKRNGELFEK